VKALQTTKDVATKRHSRSSSPIAAAPVKIDWESLQENVNSEFETGGPAYNLMQDLDGQLSRTYLDHYASGFISVHTPLLYFIPVIERLRLTCPASWPSTGIAVSSNAQVRRDSDVLENRDFERLWDFVRMARQRNCHNLMKLSMLTPMAVMANGGGESNSRGTSSRESCTRDSLWGWMVDNHENFTKVQEQHLHLLTNVAAAFDNCEEHKQRKHQRGGGVSSNNRNMTNIVLNKRREVVWPNGTVVTCNGIAATIIASVPGLGNYTVEYVAAVSRHYHYNKPALFAVELPTRTISFTSPSKVGSDKLSVQFVPGLAEQPEVTYFNQIVPPAMGMRSRADMRSRLVFGDENLVAARSTNEYIADLKMMTIFERFRRHATACLTTISGTSPMRDSIGDGSNVSGSRKRRKASTHIGMNLASPIIGPSAQVFFALNQPSSSKTDDGLIMFYVL